MSRRVLIVGAVAATLGFLLSWVGSSPSHITGLQWDTGTYLARFAASGSRLRRLGSPWASHLALPYLYIASCNAAGLVGSTCVGGFRLLQSLGLAGAAGLLALTAARLSRSLVVALLTSLAFVTAWGTFTFIFAMVDDLLYLPLTVGVLFICVVRVDDWRDRDSVTAGLLVGAAVLLSLQCVLYLTPPLVVIAAFGGTRAWPRRLRHAALFLGAFAGTLAAWAVVIGATTTTVTTTQVFETMAARPQATFFPRDLRGLEDLFSIELFRRHLGIGIAQQLVAVGDSDPLWRRMPSVGLWLVAVETALFVGATVHYVRRRRGASLVVLTLTLLAFTIAASLYHDLYTDKYKRYGFLPLLIWLVVAALCGLAARRHGGIAAAVAVALCAVVGVQVARATSANLEWHRKQPTFPRGLNEYYGRDGLSWLGYFEKLRGAHPDSCRFVFDIREVRAIRYNHEIDAGLAAELPAYVLVGTPMDLFGWKRRPALVGPDEQRQWTACDWISSAAHDRLQAP